jgi:hypothetical protein
MPSLITKRLIEFARSEFRLDWDGKLTTTIRNTGSALPRLRNVSQVI